jgi:radical SAM/Cys-rich protein
MKSLKAQLHNFSDSQHQLTILRDNENALFEDKLNDLGLFPLRATGVEILQLNIGKMCNQVCKHCHVDAGPDRKEIMTKETMMQCLEVIRNSSVTTVDLTGGAPEMNPHFRWLVEEIWKTGKKIMVRCNLTIILANPKYHDLPEFYRQHQVEVVSSLPYYTALRTDNQRGDGVFERSIKALQMLNDSGYGKEGTNLILNLVYNPSGAFLPTDQKALEKDFKKELKLKYGIHFNSLYAITNLPVSRFLEYLVRSGNYEAYMEKLVASFNPAAAQNVMCRNTLSVGWDGFLYDCDFNQMLDLRVNDKMPQHIKDYKIESLNNREIVINQHCFGCTAGAGSSCGGTVV